MEVKINVHNRMFSLSYSEEIQKQIDAGTITKEELVQIIERQEDEIEAVPFGEPFLITGTVNIMAIKLLGDIHVKKIMTMI